MNTNSVSAHEYSEQRLRTLLQHLLSLQSLGGSPLIDSAKFCAEVLADSSARFGWSSESVSAPDLERFAKGEGIQLGASDTMVLMGQVELRYRHLVCGIGQPLWLSTECPPPLLHPDFPVHVTDYEAKKKYTFSIAPFQEAPKQLFKRPYRK